MSEETSVKEPAERTAAVSFTEINARRRGPIRRYFRRHPRVMDAVVVVGYLMATLPGTVLAAGIPGGWWALAPIAAAAVALGFRRDRPLTVLSIVTLIEPFGLLLTDGRISVGFAIWFALYAVAVSHRFRTVSWAFAAAAVVSVGAWWFTAAEMFDEEPWLIWLIVGFVLMWYILAVGVGLAIRRDRLHEIELREWADRNAELASANERNRIAREMHDVVTHSLSVMVALSDGAAVVMKRDQARAKEVLAELSTTGRTALADMRRVLGVLRESPETPRDPLPAADSLAALLDGFRAAGLPVTTIFSGPELPPDPAFQLTVYRIVQESLTNVLRYGKGVTTVEVSLARNADLVRIRVSDDGRGSMGPQASVGSGQGIAGMRERASIYQGTVECGPRGNGGWAVNAILMVPTKQDSTMGE